MIVTNQRALFANWMYNIDFLTSDGNDITKKMRKTSVFGLDGTFLYKRSLVRHLIKKSNVKDVDQGKTSIITGVSKFDQFRKIVFL